MREIDIQSDEAGVYEIAQRMTAYLTEPVALSESDRLCSHFGCLRVDGMQYPVMKLEYEAVAYRQMGRAEKPG